MLQIWWVSSRHNWRSRLKLKRDGYALELDRGAEDVRFARDEKEKESSRRHLSNLAPSQIGLWERSHFLGARIVGGELCVWARKGVDLVFSRRVSEVNWTLL